MKISEKFLIYGSGFISTIISFSYFQIIGYPLVNTINETLSIHTPPIYMIPIFFPYGILLGEFVWLWVQKTERFKSIILFVECLIIGTLSFIRINFFIPFSGHAIIIMFYLFHQIVNNRINYKLRIVIGLIVLVITAVYKLMLWNDPITFLLGSLVGIMIFTPGMFYRIKRTSE